ncbi:MAG: hypothetical protein HND52_01660 [Ignavibacteriae bacterium]|nr:hypothetical protein [Ignavibacteriota bacterium]NOG96657.1 hypothetical protein [Ignavibacteriota bacterium]
MKKLLFILVAVMFLAISPNKTNGQVSVDLQVFEPLPEINFAAFLLVNNLAGAPRIFSVRMEPKGVPVKLEGVIKWKKNQQSNFERLYTFLTQEFQSRNLSNTEIGNSDILIESDEMNSVLRDEALNKGKPTGTYLLEVRAIGEGGTVLGDDSHELLFLNPTQSLTIRIPRTGSSQNVGSVLTEWDQVLGVSGYSVKANVRTSGSQSLEEALESGNPIINNRDVGLKTVVNLRELLDREWLPGQEIVLQVTAIVEGPSGGNELFSNIVNFYLEDSESPFTAKLNNNIRSILESLPKELLEDTELLERLAEGDVEIIEIIREDGTKLTRLEIDELVSYLRDNPEVIVSFTENN